MDEIMPAVSVIMNCYNGAEYLREALDSVYSQTFNDWEIVFWDNASTDQSLEIARSYGDRVRVFCNQATIPLGEARNSAMSEARGEFIAFLDTDDAWYPRKLERQLPLFDSRREVGLVHSDVVCVQQSDGTKTNHFARLGHAPRRGSVFGYLLRHNAIAMPSVVLRAEALCRQTEWFDPRFEIYPDFDLFRRIAYEWECDYIDEPLAMYRIHEKSSSSRNHLRAADELAQTIAKFRKIYPALATDFPQELAYLEAMVTYQRGKSLWRLGSGAAARREFAAQLGTPKVALAWLSSWLPYPLVERIWSWWQGQGIRTQRDA